MIIARWLSVLLLLVTGVLGILNGTHELGDARTALQKSVTIGVLVYGVLGLLGAMALARRLSISLPLAAAWAVVVTYVASTAAIAYAGEEATVVGAVAAGVATALIGAGVVYVARRTTRRAPGEVA
jgi:hypothetical protein